MIDRGMISLLSLSFRDHSLSWFPFQFPCLCCVSVDTFDVFPKLEFFTAMLHLLLLFSLIGANFAWEPTCFFHTMHLHLHVDTNNSFNVIFLFYSQFDYKSITLQIVGLHNL